MTATFLFGFFPLFTSYILHTVHLVQLTHNMALPVIKSIADCTDFSKTVLPYIGQLYDLPQQVFDNINNVQALKVLYVSTNPLISAFAFSLLIFPIFLLVSEINRNYSQVDRCWSILPTIYNAHFAVYAHATGLSTRRLDMLLLFSTIWSVSSRVSRRHRLLLTVLGAIVIQLLAKRRIQHWFRRLSMGCPERIYKPTTVLRLQRVVHFLGSERKQSGCVGCGNHADIYHRSSFFL